MRKRLIMLLILIAAPLFFVVGRRMQMASRYGSRPARTNCGLLVREAFEKKYPNYPITGVMADGNPRTIGYAIWYTKPNDKRAFSAGGGYEEAGQCVINENINEQVDNNRYVIGEN